MKNTCILFLFILFLFKQTYSQTVIHMTEQGGVFMMPCLINGLPLNFIFDTGASDVSISLTEASFMLKNGFLNDSDIISEEKYIVATGEVQAGAKINLKTLVIGSKTLYNVEATVIYQLNAPLLLGQSALSKLGKYTFDYSNNSLIVDEGVMKSTTLVTQTDYFNAAKAAIDNDNYVKAIEISNNYINAFPDQPQGYSFLVKASKIIDSDTTKGLAVSAILRQNNYLAQNTQIANRDRTMFANLYYLLVYYTKYATDLEKQDEYKRAIYITKTMKEIFSNPNSEEFKYADGIEKQIITALKKYQKSIHRNN